jgi:hypothetical protein
VEACELILRQFSEVGCEGGNGVRIASFEFGKSILVALVSGITMLLGAKGLEYTERLGLAPQDQVADRPSAEPFHLVCESCAGTDASAELFVGRLESRGHIDGVAISSVVEETATAKISYNRWPSMDPDAGDAQRNAFWWQRWRNASAYSSSFNAQATARAA